LQDRDRAATQVQLARQEIDKVLGDGYATDHPDVVIAVMQTAASDWAAARLAVAIERVAEALVEPEQETHIVQPHELVRARP
jgi:hypothetical protein